jgi:PhzF family phenazine biosynthesis protein
MKLALYQADAFTSRLFGGNPAAVIPLDAWLPDEKLQQIALENNLSETAFVVNDGSQLHIRWFTPTVEVALCGHATLASAHILWTELGYRDPVLTFQSKSGPLRVRQVAEGVYELDFPSQPASPSEAAPGLIEAIGATPAAVLFNTDYVLIFSTEAEVAALKPNFAQLANVPARGIIATAPGDTCDYVLRFFGPQSGIDEDPVTGSAQTKLIPYWSERLGKKVLISRQISARVGDITGTLNGDRVGIAGSAVTYLKGEIWV